ncbi:L,D-transpeptidase family protein [Piscirickettsia litoralis]|uniref:L,D-transpeptidase catalytic domain protein n=1 Tax=Piscirickettsia litoralis TaxID=1891921 RepID=A0ABX3A3Y9_9GAMM|nr:L,D-transpeptidase family protein [Piscirickettsia litoralis]ODN43344.1 L,D-transpeptidase catalytic domain protein [Piscirickettsia litoralis]
MTIYHKIKSTAVMTILGASFLLTDQAAAFTLPLSNYDDVIGWQVITYSKPGDTRLKVAERHSVSVHRLQALNPQIRYWQKQRIYLPYQVVLPQVIKQQKKGITVNLAEKRLYHFNPTTNQLSVYPVSIGREHWRTPAFEKTTYVISKKKHPTWNVPISIQRYYRANGKILPKQVPPGPENPLGTRALYLGVKGILIHGTNRPASIGKASSSGCIRLYPNDIEHLYEHAGINTPVTFIYQPYKVGFSENILYIEAHPHIQYYDKDNQHRQLIIEKIKVMISQSEHLQVNWDLINKALNEATGIPVPIGKKFY